VSCIGGCVSTYPGAKCWLTYVARTNRALSEDYMANRAKQYSKFYGTMLQCCTVLANTPGWLLLYSSRSSSCSC
jgi:hypothetical protein